jgi:hypothetical protein
MILTLFLPNYNFIYTNSHLTNKLVSQMFCILWYSSTFVLQLRPAVIHFTILIGPRTLFTINSPLTGIEFKSFDLRWSFYISVPKCVNARKFAVKRYQDAHDGLPIAAFTCAQLESRGQPRQQRSRRQPDEDARLLLPDCSKSGVCIWTAFLTDWKLTSVKIELMMIKYNLLAETVICLTVS